VPLLRSSTTPGRVSSDCWTRGPSAAKDISRSILDRLEPHDDHSSSSSDDTDDDSGFLIEKASPNGQCNAGSAIC
jgi:hypothetical protein